MGVITDRSYISCCEREDDSSGSSQPPYLHFCGCPQVTSYAVSLTQNADLCGFPEYDTDVITASTPPKKYRRKDGYHSYSNGDEGTIFQEYSASNCELATDAPKTLESGSVINFNLNETDTYVVSTVFWEYTDSDPTTINRTLSIEDTENDALARAEIVSGSVKSTLWTIRTDDFDFVKRSSSYSLVASNLQHNANYVVKIGYRRRPVIKVGSGYVDENGSASVWTTTDDSDAEMVDEYSFTATGSTMVVPTTGTWTDDDSDGIIDSDEVDPSIVIPLVRGWQYEILSPRIELA